MGRNKKAQFREEGETNRGTKSEKKKTKRSSRHNSKIMIDKVSKGLVDSTDLEEYLDSDFYDD